MNIKFISRKTKSEVIEMAKNKSNKNSNDDKSSNTKTETPITMETDKDMHKPARGLTRM